jgi:endonuclease/exonuclease/phosphatase family metal-dependent hydrolase
LRILTVNVWTGLDYIGIFRMGEYEPRERRDARFLALVTQLKQLSLDVIFVQEANPLPQYASRLASALSMKEIHQVVNGGIKVGNLGIPANMKEGLVILAKPGLSLQKEAAWKLSGSAGIHTDHLNFQLNEAVMALVGKIDLAGQPIYLVNVHLVAAPEFPDDADELRETVLTNGEMEEAAFNDAIKVWRRRETRRGGEIENLLRHLEKLPPGIPVIVAGDFNAVPQSHEMDLFAKKGFFADVLDHRGTGLIQESETFTWDAELNRNTAFSTTQFDARGKGREGFDFLAARSIKSCCRLDYIYLNEDLSKTEIVDKGIVLTEQVNGVQVSDHFAVMAEIMVNGNQSSVIGNR